MATGLLNGGRYVIAIAVGWWAYAGMGGTLAPVAVDASVALAFIVLCVVYTLVRRFCAWPMLVLQSVDPHGSTAPLRALETVFAPAALLVELLPLPVALLVSATFVALGWSGLLLLALVFIGLSAVMRQMSEAMGAMREQRDLAVLIHQVDRAIARTVRDAPQDVDALCALTYSLCTAISPAAKFEMGLYDSTATYVHLRVARDGDVQLPPMSIPLTPLWSWLSERREPFLAETEAQLVTLPFELPPIDLERTPRSAMFVPLLHNGTDRTASRAGDPVTAPDTAAGNATTGRALGARSPTSQESYPIGAIVLQSPHPRAYSARDAKRIAMVAGQISLAIQAAQ
jgi:hypothetical protein